VHRHIVPTLGRIGLRRLCHHHTEALYDQLLTPTIERADLVPKTVYEIHLVIRGCLADAVRRGLLTRNVALLVRSPKLKAIPSASSCATPTAASRSRKGLPSRSSASDSATPTSRSPSRPTSTCCPACRPTPPAPTSNSPHPFHRPARTRWNTGGTAGTPPTAGRRGPSTARAQVADLGLHAFSWWRGHLNLRPSGYELPDQHSHPSALAGTSPGQRTCRRWLGPRPGALVGGRTG
jgi:hypothetical protein